MSTGNGMGVEAPGRLSVYVVDGDPEVGRNLAPLLRTLHLEVEVFESAEGALPRILEAPPGCLISEVYLPGLSGIELLRELRDEGSSIPVIILAAQADVPLAVEAMQLGALDFIEKPVVDRIVLARVREALHLPPPERNGMKRGDAAHG